MLEALAGSSPAAALRLLSNHVLEELARVVRMDAAELDADTSFSELGVDSLMGIELRNRLGTTTGVALPSTAIWTYPTPTKLAQYIASVVATPDPDQPPGTAAQASRAHEPDKDEQAALALGDEVAEALLLDELDGLEELLNE